MFQPISKHFGVFIDDLGQNFSFSFEVLLSLAAGLNLAVLLMYVLFEWRGGRFLTEVASASGAISVEIGFAFAGDLWLFFPLFGQFVEVIEVGVVDEFSHVHFKL